mmetsp:Transcript_7212/g.26371  ORF Transcript_7212/g.26371 Transcript_7212/m.26371 type:complete len:216 (+) Transcript_7212:1393-2040(+)
MSADTVHARSRANSRSNTRLPSASASSYESFLVEMASALASHAIFIARLRLFNVARLPEFKKLAKVFDARRFKSVPSATTRSSALCMSVDKSAKGDDMVIHPSFVPDSSDAAAGVSPSMSIVDGEAVATSSSLKLPSSSSFSTPAMKRITGDISKFSLSVPAASPIAVDTTEGSSGDAPDKHAKNIQIRNRFIKCVACAPIGPGVSQANINAAAY